MTSEKMTDLLYEQMTAMSGSQVRELITVRHLKKRLTDINQVSGVSSLAWREAGDTYLNHTRLDQLR